ncbi:protein BTG4-like [Hyperolius riggenbachi]|uniref:protein BTG4-like n=1 Tax=Hyperolius riggenbachi TaxID=752182 RepID=UPI0035A3BD7A
MREELIAAVEFIKAMANRLHRLDSAVMENFGDKLTEILCEKFMGHWYPQQPVRGNAYRCIRSAEEYQDESLVLACALCGLYYEELSLPVPFTVWIDPYEVSCQIGDNNYPQTVAAFHPLAFRVPAMFYRYASSSDCSTCSSSVPSSSSGESEEDSGIEDGRMSSPVQWRDVPLQVWGPIPEPDSEPEGSDPFRAWFPQWLALEDGVRERPRRRRRVFHRERHHSSSSSD